MRYWKCPKCGPNIEPTEVLDDPIQREEVHAPCGQPVRWRYLPWPEMDAKPVVPVNYLSVCSLHNQQFLDGCPTCAKIGARAIAVRPAGRTSDDPLETGGCQCPQCQAAKHGESPLKAADGAEHRTTIAFNRLASLMAEAYGEEGLPDAPYALRLAFGYAIEVALGIVPWPSEEATQREEAIRAVLPTLAEEPQP